MWSFVAVSSFFFSVQVECFTVKSICYIAILKGDNIMAQVNFRVDDAVKAKAESACIAMGLTMSSAINIFLTKVANER